MTSADLRSQTRAVMESLVRQRRDRWVRRARRFVDDPHAAEDVVQEALARVWRRLEAGGPPPARLAAYVGRTVETCALKYRLRRRRLASLEDAAQAVDDLPDSTAGEPEAGDEDLTAWVPLALEQALAGLPPTQQAALRMRYYVGLSFVQIGQALSVPANTAASRCRYGLAALRALLRPHRPGGPEA